MTRQGKTRLSQGETITRQDKTKLDMKRQTRQKKARPNNHKTTQQNTRQNKTRQHKTKLHQTRKDKRQDNMTNAQHKASQDKKRQHNTIPARQDTIRNTRQRPSQVFFFFFRINHDSRNAVGLINSGKRDKCLSCLVIIKCCDYLVLR